MLYKLRVVEVAIHEIYVEADDEDQAEQEYMERFGDPDFDEIINEDIHCTDIEEAE